jgi:putative hemolysin
LSELDDAIELGRSFVRVESQKEFAPLMLLWKGIGQFVVRHPRYRRLFGPVSISNEYHTMTRWLLMAFLRLNNHLPRLARFVMPRTPPRMTPPRELSSLMDGTTVRSMEEVGRLVDEIEAGRRSVPVLLRQYLKLNAKLLGFNIDRGFGDVLDALMLVDLTHVDRPILARYLGREGMETFLAWPENPGGDPGCARQRPAETSVVA